MNPTPPPCTINPAQAEAGTDQNLSLLALQASGSGSWMFQTQTGLIVCDDAARALSGLEASLTARTLLRRLLPEDRSRLLGAIRSGKRFNLILQLLTSDEPRMLLCQGGPAGPGIWAGLIQPRQSTGHSPQLCRQALEQAGFGMLIADSSGNILLTNKSLSHQSGYSPEELYLTGLNGLFRKEEFHKLLEHTRGLKSGEQRQLDLEMPLLRKDGTTVFMRNTLSLLQDEYGQTDRMYLILQDISSELATRDQQRKLQALVDNSVDLMSVLEEGGINSYINKAGRELLGLETEEDVRSTPISSLHPEEELEFVQRVVIPAIVQEGRWSGVMQVRNAKTGEVFPVLNNAVRIDDPEGKRPPSLGAVMRDLRQEQASQKALMESESRFRNIIAQAPVAIGMLEGPDMIIRSANSHILELWGKTSDIIDQPLLKALPEIEGQVFMELLRKVLTTGIPYYGYETLAQLVRNGKLEDAYFNFVYAPMHGLDGSISGVLVVATELTAQVKAKKELQVSEQRFRNLIQEAPMATAVYTGREMTISLANERMIKLWGKDNSVRGRLLMDAVPELQGQPFLELLQRVYDTGVPYQATEDPAMLMVNGKLETFYFNFTYKPLRDASGQVYGILNMAADVTALVKARHDVRQAEAQMRLAVEAAAMGTWSIDLEKRQLHCSERIRQWYGFQHSVISLQDALKAVHPNDQDALRQLMDSILNGQADSVVNQHRIISLQDGQERIIRVAGKASLNQDGRPLTISGAAQDITAEKMNEQELERQVQWRTEELRKTNQKLRQTNQELEQFAYISSHDLQEPVRKILTFTEMIRNRCPQMQQEPGHTLLQKVYDSAARMQQVIRDLLQYSQLGQVNPAFERTDLNEVLHQVSTDLELLIQQKEARIDTVPLPVIDAIPLQMAQLFYNLVHNALKFARQDVKPVITIGCRLLPAAELQAFPQLETGLQYAEIRLQDNGIGFNDALYGTKIFTIFQRLHDRKSYSGTGIGLALCKKVADNHHGALYVRSSEGAGACFYIILPLHQSHNKD